MTKPIPTPTSSIIQTINQPVVDLKTGKVTRAWRYKFAEINSAIDALVNEGGSTLGTHTVRLATPVTNLPQGDLWYETDRTVTYIASTGWTYVGGVMTAPAANAPTDLGALDAGFLFMCSDFGHLLQWSGTAWTFAPSDTGVGYFADFAVAPASGLWAPCDGTATSYLTVGATLTTTPFTTPNLQTGAAGGAGVYRKGAAAYSGVVVTTGGVLTGAGAVDVAHINVLPYFRR